MNIDKHLWNGLENQFICWYIYTKTRRHGGKMYFFCLSNVSSCVCAVHIKLWDEYAKRNTVSWRLCCLNCDYRFVCHIIKYISSGYWSWLSQTRVRGSLRVFSPFTRIFLEEKTMFSISYCTPNETCLIYN